MATSLQNTTIIKPSQWINIGWIIFSGFVLLKFHFNIAKIPVGLLALAIALYKYIEVSMWEYVISKDTIMERKGVFNITEEQVQCFRIKSIKVEKPFLMRLVGLSIIQIRTSEEFKPNFTFYAIENGEMVKNILDAYAQVNRSRFKVKEIDFHSV